MADVISDGAASSSLVASGQSCAGLAPLLGYLKQAGFCDQRLREVQDILINECFRYIDITISRMDGENLDFTISCYLTAGGLKKRLAGEWSVLKSSLQLVIGSTYLRDDDVIGVFEFDRQSCNCCCQCLRVLKGERRHSLETGECQGLYGSASTQTFDGAVGAELPLVAR